MYISTRLALVVVALAAVAAALGPPLAIAIAGVCVVTAAGIVLEVLASSRPRDLGVRRTAPSVASLGRPSQITLGVRNERARALRVKIRDATPPSADRTPPVHAVNVPPGGTVEVTGTVTPSRRGTLSLGPVTVRIAGPLGLAGRQATLAVVDRVRVFPSLPGRAEVALRLQRARMLQGGRRSSRFYGGGTDFDSLREYHPDDEFRKINWTATARAAKPIANVYREERNQQMFLLLDAGRAMAGSVAGVPRFEHGLDAAIALADLGSRVGDHVGMLAFASRVAAFLPARGGVGQSRRILDLLFDIEPALEAPAYLDAFATLLSRSRRRSLLVLFTELAEESSMDPLFEAVPALLAHHLLIVASIRDPDVVAMRDRIPASSEDAFLAAAAAQTLDARARTAARLLAMGAIVEDREPGRLAGAVADRYLGIKGAGRL